jgi:RNA polymerase primary sigma factor
MLLAYHAGEIEQVDRLVKAGDRTVVQIPLAITEKTLSVGERPAHSPTTGHADLLVALLDEKEGNEHIYDRVFRFREPHMVVRNERTRDLSVSARPYVAVLICGNAKRDRGDKDNKMEWFLRAAEPPAHDKWVHNTDALKDEYKTYGLKAAFENFEKETKSKIKALVSVPEEKGGELPKDVTRYLKLGGNHGRTNGSVVTGRSKGQMEGGIWKISSTVKCPLKGDDAPTPWYAEIKIQIETDDTARTIDIAEIACEDATSTVIKNGVATIHFPANVRKAGVRCETLKSSLSAFGQRAPAKISVTGAKIAPITIEESATEV